MGKYMPGMPRPTLKMTKDWTSCLVYNPAIILLIPFVPVKMLFYFCTKNKNAEIPPSFSVQSGERNGDSQWKSVLHSACHHTQNGGRPGISARLLCRRRRCRVGKKWPERKFLEERKTWFHLSPALVTGENLEQWEAGEYCPWGWSPRMYFLLREKHIGEWKPEWKELYGRRTAATCLQTLCRKLGFVEKETLPVVCETIRDIENAAKGGRYLAKAPWSSSGRGLLKISGEEIPSKNREWLGGILKKQGFVMLEKEQERVADFAMEFHTCGGKVEFRGLSCFMTGEAGEYIGNYVGDQQTMEERLTAWVEKEKLEHIKTALIQLLTEEIAPRYNGYMGVDMMIYRNPQGKICIQPCLEINLRYTMGILALFLSERFVAEGAEGTFSIVHYNSDGEALRFHDTSVRQYPIHLHREKITEGYAALTPVRQDTRFAAYLQVRKK